MPGVLLHRVEGPINLGSVCRAMANTGFSHLAFTGPLKKSAPKARRFALHAQNILDQAQKHATLGQMIGPYQIIVGFTPRNPWQDGHNLSFDELPGCIEDHRSKNHRVGLLFGNEASGLTNNDLAHCRYRVALPTQDTYPSMNLSHAVMVVLWTLRQIPRAKEETQPELASLADVERLVEKMRAHLDLIAHLNPQNKERVWNEVSLLLRSHPWTERERTLIMSIIHKSSSRYRALQRRLGTEVPSCD